MQLSWRQKLELKAKIFVLCAKQGWSWDHVRRVTHTVFAEGDTSTIRVILANASFLWALFVVMDPDVFHRPAYEVMQVVADYQWWATAFLMHGLGVYWRAYDPRRRIVPGLIVNGFGFLIWFFSTVSLNYYVGALSPATAIEFAMCFASGWALYKTGFSRELLSP